MDVEDAENGLSILSAILNSADSQPNEVLSPEDLDGVSVLTSILNSTGSQQKEVISPEDLAWVDSCLVKDSDISESDWIPLKNALLDIIDAQSQSFSANGGENIEIPPYIEEKKIKNVSLELNQESSMSNAEPLSEPQKSSMSDAMHLSEPSSSHNVKPLRMAVGSNTDEIPDNEKNETLSSSTFHGNPFLPTYNEDLKENETKTIDLGLNLDSSIYELERASENIFKVWDLDVASEEGELVKQLNKALSENTFSSSSSHDSMKWKEGLLDDLVAGIADLSLNKNV